MFYASFFFFLSSKSIPRKVSSKILIQDFIRLNELMSFGMIYYTWSRDDKYPQVPQDLSAHLAGYLGFACRSRSTSTFIYSFFFFSFFPPFDPTSVPFNVARIRKNRVRHSNFARRSADQRLSWPENRSRFEPFFG